MSFPFVNFATNELSKSPLNDIVSNMISGYKDTTTARYLKPGLEQELQKAKLFNKYYSPDMESQIALHKAQTGESGARTGLIGEQTRGTHIENQYLPEKMKAQVAEANANAQKARLMQMIREQLMGGGLQQGDTQFGSQKPNSDIEMFKSQGMPIENAQHQQDQQFQQSASQQQRGVDYAQAATAMQLLGLGRPQVVDANGRYMAITPFGNIDTGISGLTQKQKEFTKLDSKKVSDLEDTVLNNSSKLDTFNELNSILGSPAFEQMRQNPLVGRHELGWYSKFGTPEQQDIVGKAQTYMGNIIKDSARDFAGQFRVGEQALLNGMKPNQSDSIDVMKGKAEALTFLTTMMTKRAEFEADMIRNQNISPLAAKIASDKMINTKQIKEEIRTILHPASSKKFDITPAQAIAELQRRQAIGGQ